jgi:MFS family permease
MVPGIFSLFIGGMIADRIGFPEVFAIGLIIQCIIILFLIRYLRENPLPRRIISFSEFYSFMKRNISPPITLRGIYLLNMFDAAVVGLGPVLVIGILSVHFNFSIFQLGVVSILRVVVTMVTQIFIGNMIRKYGCKNVLIVSYISWVLYIGGMILSNNFFSILLIQIFMGISIATWITPHKTLMANSTTPLERAEAMGRISLYRGIFSFFAPFLGGFLYEQYGYSAPLLASFVLGVIVTFFIYFYIHVKDDKLI